MYKYYNFKNYNELCFKYANKANIQFLDDEIRNSYEIEDMYVILDKLMHDKTFAKWDNLKNCSLSDEYSSDKVEQLSKEELIDILHKEKLIIEEN